MRGRSLAPAVAGLIAIALATSVRADSAFSHWAAVVVAGDDHAAHADELTETFDNARRDIAGALVKRGFNRANIRQFSLRPARYPDTRPDQADFSRIDHSLESLTKSAPEGCLIYFTSHGAPEGLVLNDRILPPSVLAEEVNARCGRKPTVIVLSACFSGVFVPRLKGDHRLIMTAARRDRSSFGCGESDTYPFFDSCILEALPTATDFIALSEAARICVARKEREEGATPPSRPQTWIGGAFRAANPAFAPTGPSGGNPRAPSLGTAP